MLCSAVLCAAVCACVMCVCANYTDFFVGLVCGRGNTRGRCISSSKHIPFTDTDAINFKAFA